MIKAPFALFASLGLAIAMSACGNSDAESDTATDQAASQAETTAGAAESGATGITANLQQPASVASYDIVEGAEDAPVTVVEYGALTCGACAAFNDFIMPDLRERYIESGKIRYVFREFLLNRVDAEASLMLRCVEQRNGQEAYENMINLMFRTQQNWRVAPYSENIQEIATQAGLNQDAYNECLNNEQSKDILRAHRQTADELNVTGTPTVFVEGEKVDYRTIQDLKDKLFADIDEALIAAGVEPPSEMDAAEETDAGNDMADIEATASTDAPADEPAADAGTDTAEDEQE